MKIVTLEAKNIMKLKAVRIDAEGKPVIIIGGENEQGKTSVLECIEMGLDGKAIVEEPIRRGERNGLVVIDLGDIVIRKIFSPSGPRLEITGKTQGKTPQALLDSLRSKFIDPVELTRMKPDKFQNLIKELAGINLNQENEEYQKNYDERRDVNRDIKALESQIEAIPEENVPVTEQSMDNLTMQLTERIEANQANDKQRLTLDLLKQKNEAMRERGRALNEQIEKLQAQKDQLLQEYKASKSQEAIMQQAIDELRDLPIDSIQTEIKNLEITNQKIREQNTRKQLIKKLESLRLISTKHSECLDSINEVKKQKLSKAKYPIEGLMFTESGVKYRNTPFEQCSSAERLRIGVAIGLAMNPKLKVLIIKDGSLLDKKNLAMISKMAQENDAQIWIEKVTNDAQEATVIIEDGEVRGVTKSTKATKATSETDEPKQAENDDNEF